MYKTAEKIVNAFLMGNAQKGANTKTDGQSLWLFDNKIAEHRPDGLYITNCGWFSKTTKERLNNLIGVSISQKKGKWYLNGEEWDGTWVKVNDNAPPNFDADKVGKMMVKEVGWVSTDGWRGYQRPIYAIAGANDTGMWDDSPCPSDVAERELNDLKKKLRGIPHEEMVCETSNVFCIHRYIIVPPFYLNKAKEIVSEHINNTQTRLLYEA